MIAERVGAIKAIRAHAAEFRLVIAKGPHHVATLLDQIVSTDDAVMPPVAKRMIVTLATHLQELEARLAEIDAELHAAHRANEASQRLATIPGVGPITASALVASVGDVSRRGDPCLGKRKSPNVAATALGDKNAWIVWALPTRNQIDRVPIDIKSATV